MMRKSGILFLTKLKKVLVPYLPFRKPKENFLMLLTLESLLWNVLIDLISALLLVLRWGFSLLCRSAFSSITQDKHLFSSRLKFTSSINLDHWTLVAVYGPSCGHDRENFANWLNNFDIEEDGLWLILGDFNFYRCSDNRNRVGGNYSDNLLFNSIISNVGLIVLCYWKFGTNWLVFHFSGMDYQISQYHGFFLWLELCPITSLAKLCLITSLAKYKLTPIFQRQMSSDLKIVS